MRFEWKGRDCGTYGKIGDALCALETREEAADFWRAYVEHLNNCDDLEMPAEDVARSNIGYLMGYYGPEERARVYGLFEEFSVDHPIFGKTEPTPEEAFTAGQEWAKGER